MIALRNKAKNLTEWKSKKLEMDRNAQKLKDLENKIASKNTSIEDITLKLQEYEKEYQDKQENLSNLKKSEEETLNALFIIKKIIGPETKVCPVCQAEYTPGVLEKRIMKALKYINPLLDKADKEEKEGSAI